MSTTITTTGAASAAPTVAAAHAFVAIGGRLMIDPQGRYASTIDTAALFESTTNPPPDPSAFAERREIASRFVRIERRHRKCLAQLAREHGRPVNGWLVWEGAPC